MIEEWFEEYLNSDKGKLYRSDESEFIIYKGFKIEKDRDSDLYTLLDVRFSDFYTMVTPVDFRILMAYGFIKGCDMIMYYRDCKRAKKHRDIIEDLFRERTELNKTKTSHYKRRLSGIKRLLSSHRDKLLFYHARKCQVETKYKIEA